MTRAADLAKLIAGGGSITVSDNSENLKLVTTDADASVGPTLRMDRQSSSAADSDLLGKINFVGHNDAGTPEDIAYAGITAIISDASDGTEDGKLAINTIVAGTERSRIFVDAGETVINEDSIDVDFRVESNGNANMLFVDGGNDRVGIGTNSPSVLLDLESTDPKIRFTDSDATGTPECEISGGGGDITIRADRDGEKDSSIIGFEVDGSEKMRIDGNGNVGIGDTSPENNSNFIALTVTSTSGTGGGQVYVQSSSVNSVFGADNNSSDPKSIVQTVTSHPLRLGTNNTERMRITSGGNISLGANTTSNIETTILMTMTGNGTHADHFWEVGPHYTGDTPAFYTINESGTGVVLTHGNNSWSSHSDERIKENITSLENVLPDLKNVRCVKYNLKGQTDTKIGFIAQDWESKFPEVVDENSRQVIESDGSLSFDTKSESTTKVKVMQYTETIPVLLKAIQELEARIATLESK